jgi:hypothetical protein
MKLKRRLERDLEIYGLKLSDFDCDFKDYQYSLGTFIAKGLDSHHSVNAKIDDCDLEVIDQNGLKVPVKARVYSEQGTISKVKWLPKLSRIGEFQFKKSDQKELFKRSRAKHKGSKGNVIKPKHKTSKSAVFLLFCLFVSIWPAMTLFYIEKEISLRGTILASEADNPSFYWACMTVLFFLGARVSLKGYTQITREVALRKKRRKELYEKFNKKKKESDFE